MSFPLPLPMRRALDLQLVFPIHRGCRLAIALAGGCGQLRLRALELGDQLLMVGAGEAASVGVNGESGRPGEQQRSQCERGAQRPGQLRANGNMGSAHRKTAPQPLPLHLDPVDHRSAARRANEKAARASLDGAAFCCCNEYRRAMCLHRHRRAWMDPLKRGAPTAEAAAAGVRA